jgi:hypothetical protein
LTLFVTARRCTVAVRAVLIVMLLVVLLLLLLFVVMLSCHHLLAVLFILLASITLAVILELLLLHLLHLLHLLELLLLDHFLPGHLSALVHVLLLAIVSGGCPHFVPCQLLLALGRVLSTILRLHGTAFPALKLLFSSSLFLLELFLLLFSFLLLKLLLLIFFVIHNTSKL